MKELFYWIKDGENAYRCIHSLFIETEIVFDSNSHIECLRRHVNLFKEFVNSSERKLFYNFHM